jgi:hypothetical protein
MSQPAASPPSYLSAAHLDHSAAGPRAALLLLLPLQQGPLGALLLLWLLVLVLGRAHLAALLGHHGPLQRRL